MRGVAVLGSTGSIGVSTLRVLARHPERFRPVALVAGRNHALLAEQVATWQPACVGLVAPEAGVSLPNGTHRGPEALLEAVTRPDVDIVVNAVVGAAGLDATLTALRHGKRVALANKESLVMAGPLVAEAARAGGGEIVPIDSEHSAVLQCLASHDSAPSRIVLTASGGPFRTWEPEAIAQATVAEALQHPTWRMGAKITVDSASLANKALEVIEAHFLFGLPYPAIEVVVHPQSLVHAFVEFPDGSMLAQLGVPSMEIPILYALTWPERRPDAGVQRFDPLAAGSLTFEPVRGDIFRAFTLGVAAGRTGGTAPAAFNAANEVAVAAFLAGQIRFGAIADVIDQVLSRHQGTTTLSQESVLAADAEARRLAQESLS